MVYCVLNKIQLAFGKKVKEQRAVPFRGVGGCSFPFLWPLIYGYLSCCGASSPFGQYHIILLGEQRHMCVNNLPKVVTWQCSGPESIRGSFGHQTGPLPLHYKIGFWCAV